MLNHISNRNNIKFHSYCQKMAWNANERCVPLDYALIKTPSTLSNIKNIKYCLIIKEVKNIDFVDLLIIERMEESKIWSKWWPKLSKFWPPFSVMLTIFNKILLSDTANLFHWICITIWFVHVWALESLTKIYQILHIIVFQFAL